MIQKFLKIIFILLSVGISFYIFVGFSTLMMADDYCYFSLIKNQSFFNTQLNVYTSAILIAGNRFSATFVSVLASLLGERIIQFFPLLTVLGLSFSFYFLFLKIMELFFGFKDRTIGAIASLILIGIIYYIAPSKFQNIYWFSGIIAYSTPIIFYSLLLGFYIHFLKSKNSTIWQFLGLSILAVFTAGYSETSAITFFIHFLFVLIFIFFCKNQKFSELKLYLPLIGLLIGIALLIFSPSALLRNSGSETMGISQITNPFAIIIKSFIFGFDFIVDQIKSFPFPIFVLVLVMISLGGLLNFRNLLNTKLEFIKTSLFICVTTYFVVSASMAPQIFAFGSYLNDRSQLIPSFFNLLGISILCINIGFFVFVRYQKSRNYLLIPILLAVVYLMRAGFSELSYKNELMLRKNLWDSRNTYIIQQVRIGEVDVIVNGIDSIESIMDFNPVCFRDYYHVKNIEVIN